MKAKVIVSFATYPARIDAACVVAENMLSRQTLKPDVVVMNVYEGHFPNRKLPTKYNKLIKLGLKVHWYKRDLKSYNKFLYVFKKYRHDIVILTDDDIDYPENLVENLVEGHKKWPEAVIASAVCLMLFNKDGTPKPRSYWPWEEKVFSKNQPFKWLYYGSGSGTLFIPDKIISDKFDIFDEDKILKELPSDDEAWLNVARILNDVDVVLYNPLYAVNDLVIDGTAQYGLHRTVNNTTRALKEHTDFMKNHGIVNTDMDPYTRYLLHELSKRDDIPDEFLGVKRSFKLFLGNIKRRIIGGKNRHQS